MEELRSRLIGTWSLISLTMHPSGESSKSQPFMSPEAPGFLIYSNDGFMASLLHEPDGSKLFSYSGPVSMSDEGGRIVVSHHVKADVHPQNIGTTQRRLPSFSEEDGQEILTIATDGPLLVEGKEMMPVVKWKRATEVYK